MTKVKKTSNVPLVANEGMILTDGYIYSKRIWLGCNDSADNYYEISEEEYAKILEIKERAGDDERS